VAIAIATVSIALTAVGSAAAADGSSAWDKFRERLSGYNEDPLALSTTGSGRFEARIDDDNQEITYSLSYTALEGAVTQAHIHLGNRSQSGGIIVFLCTNLGNGPAGTQACPAAPATITGTLRPADVIGPTGQGSKPGEYGELLRAIRAGATYANVHSSLYPGGEIRAQLNERHGHH